MLVLAALSAAPRTIDIVEVQRHAIEYARLEPADISIWKKRVRYSALLPKFQVDYERRVINEVNVDINESVYVGSSGSAVGPNQGTYAENLNANQNIGVKAVWDFSEAIFNPDSIGISEETRLLARERLSLLASVNKNYFEREKVLKEIELLETELKQRPKDKEKQHDLHLKKISFDEATAALDALTGGWFSDQIKHNP